MVATVENASEGICGGLRAGVVGALEWHCGVRWVIAEHGLLWCGPGLLVRPWVYVGLLWGCFSWIH